YPYSYGIGYDAPYTSGVAYDPGTPLVQASDASTANTSIPTDPANGTGGNAAGSGAHITVRLPENADLWFDGTQGTATAPGPGVQVSLRHSRPLARQRHHHGPEADDRVHTRRKRRGKFPDYSRNRGQGERHDHPVMTGGEGPRVVPAVPTWMNVRPVPVAGPR